MACLCPEGERTNSSDSHDSKVESSYSDWMGNLPSQLHSVQLNRLAIPGTHDSFTTSLDKSGPFAPETPKAIRDLAKVFGNLVKDIVYKWSVTQKYTVKQQLAAGIRYFDIRTSRRSDKDGFFIVHGLYGEDITSMLTEINKFLDQHPKEIVLLDFNHFYDMNQDDHLKLMGKIEKIFGSKMCPYLDMESVTLDKLWENSLQVLTFYHGQAGMENYLFWPGYKMPSPWPNTADLNKLMDFLEKAYESGRPTDTFYVTQGILTPDTSYIISHVMSSLETCMADKVAKPLTQWLKGKTCNSSTVSTKGINICIMDFVELDDFVPIVIKLNNKLLDS